MTTYISKWSRSTRLNFLILGFFLIGIWSLTFYVTERQREDMLRVLGEQELSTASIVAMEINNELDDRLRMLKIIAEKITPAILGNAESMQKFLNDHPDFSMLFNAGNIVTRLDGIAIAEVPTSTGRIGTNYSDRDYVIEALKGKATISKPVMGKMIKAPTFLISTPIRDTDGKVIGVLAGVTNLGITNFLSKIMDNKYGKTGGYLLAAPQHNLIVTATDKKRTMTPLPAPGINPLLDKYIQGFEGYGVAVNSIDIQELTASKKVPAADWFLITKIPTAEAFAPINTMQQRLISGTTFLSLLGIGLAFWLVRKQRINESLEWQVAENEETLRVNERRFRSFVENSNDLIYSLSSTGIITYVAPNIEQLLGYKSDELIGTSFTPLIHEEELPSCILSLQVLFESGNKMSGLEYRIRHKNGNWLWFVSNASRVIDPVSAEALFFGIGRNINDNKQAEEELRESDELLSLLMLNSPIHTYIQSVTPTESRTLRCSDSFQQMIGMSSQDMIGKTMEEVFPPELAAKINADNCIIVAGGKAVELEEELNGRYYNTIKFPIVQRDRTLLAGYTIDVTERILAEDMQRQFNDVLELRVDEQMKELIEERLRLQGIIRGTNSGTWEWNIQTGEVVFNERWADIIGYTLEEISPVSIETWRKFAHPDDIKRAGELLKKHFRDEVDYYEIEARMKHKNGEWVWVLDRGKVASWTSEGRPFLMFGIHQDITERKKLESQLIQSQKMEAVGQLAGGLAHDFNNVLSIINGYCCLLQMEVDRENQLYEYVSKILSASGRAGELTRSMLAFSRTQVMNPENYNLNEIVSKTGEFIEKIIGDNISFRTVINESTLPVYVDYGQIEQILINLVNNARDVMPNGGKLQIVTDCIIMDDSFVDGHGFGKAGRYAVITVSDTGTGMDEDTRKKVFEPFFTTKAVDKGTGLGLAMVYGIAKQHMGFVDVTTEVGRGTSFMIYLPIVATKAPADKVESSAGLKTLAGTETILIAEDSPELLEFMRKALVRLGYHIICAVDGEDAIEKFSENADKIQLIIMDMIMPRMSGKEAYDEIKKIRPNARALFSSGYSAHIVHQQGELGENAQFISKPVQPAVLMAKVREMLDR